MILLNKLSSTREKELISSSPYRQEIIRQYNLIIQLYPSNNFKNLKNRLEALLLAYQDKLALDDYLLHLIKLTLVSTNMLVYKSKNLVDLKDAEYQLICDSMEILYSARYSDRVIEMLMSEKEIAPPRPINETSVFFEIPLVKSMLEIILEKAVAEKEIDLSMIAKKEYPVKLVEHYAIYKLQQAPK